MLAFSQFVSRGRLASHHHVAVLGRNGNSVLILPTVSIDAAAAHAKVAGEVKPEDRALARWTNRCKFDPQVLQWVPSSWITVRPGAQLSESTVSELREVAKRYGPCAPRYTEADVATLEFISARKDKKRIAA